MPLKKAPQGIQEQRPRCFFQKEHTPKPALWRLLPAKSPHRISSHGKQGPKSQPWVPAIAHHGRRHCSRPPRGLVAMMATPRCHQGCVPRRGSWTQAVAAQPAQDGFTALEDPKPLNTSLSLKQTESTQAPSLVFAGQALRQGGPGPASAQQGEHSRLLRHGSGLQSQPCVKKTRGPGQTLLGPAHGN